LGIGPNTQILLELGYPNPKSSKTQVIDNPNDDLLKAVQKRNRTAAWIASNCNSLSRRELLVESLKRLINIDVYGKCGDFRCHLPKPGCVDLGEKYLFYLAFENSLCVDYVTEKLYKALYFKVIPVVLNGADMTRFLPPKSVSDELQTKTDS
jgi:alpha-1,3-fucosyltransferase